MRYPARRARLWPLLRIKHRFTGHEYDQGWDLDTEKRKARAYCKCGATKQVREILREHHAGA